MRTSRTIVGLNCCLRLTFMMIFVSSAVVRVMLVLVIAGANGPL